MQKQIERKLKMLESKNKFKTADYRVKLSEQ